MKQIITILFIFISCFSKAQSSGPLYVEDMMSIYNMDKQKVRPFLMQKGYKFESSEIRTLGSDTVKLRNSVYSKKIGGEHYFLELYIPVNKEDSSSKEIWSYLISQDDNLAEKFKRNFTAKMKLKGFEDVSDVHICGTSHFFRTYQLGAWGIHSEENWRSRSQNGSSGDSYELFFILNKNHDMKLSEDEYPPCQ